MTQQKAKSRRSASSTPMLEWIFGGVGLVLFVGALSVALLNGVSSDRPIAIVVSVETPQERDGRYQVEFQTFNAGDTTAAQVELLATLKRDGAVIESHTVRIELLPPQSSRRAGVLFATNPEGLDLAVDPVSYHEP